MTTDSRICGTGEHLSGRPSGGGKKYKGAFKYGRWGVDELMVSRRCSLILDRRLSQTPPSALELGGVSKVLEKIHSGQFRCKFDL